MNAGDFAWAASVALAAGFIRSFSGFGFALVAVPLLSLRLPLTLIVPLILLFDLVIGGVLTRGKWQGYRDPVIWIIFLGLMLGVPVGTTILQTTDMTLLQRALAIGIIAFAIHTMRAPSSRVPASGERPWAVVSGVAGGVLGGMFGTPGPPLVMYLTAFSGGNKTAFRDRMLLLLLLENVFRLGVFAARGLVTQTAATSAVLLMPAVGVGLWAGARAHHRASDEGFQRVIAGLLALSGFVLLVKSFR